MDPSQLKAADFVNITLPGQPYSNPVKNTDDNSDSAYVNLKKRILYDVIHEVETDEYQEILSFQPCGLHKRIHHNPSDTIVGIVTCGGLCPGLNDVIRATVIQCLDSYSCKQVIGFRYGFYGLTKQGRHQYVRLDHAFVSNIHHSGGSAIGTSRGPQDPGEMVDTLVDFGVNVLICIGGDGTQRGAYAIHETITRRGLDIGVVGIPKTIDNDVAFIDRTFGFDTAVAEAVSALRAAHCEASSHLYGVGLVRLMGRHSGFVTAQAVISASQCVHICLIPEHEISLETIFKLIERRLNAKKYCVIAVAEGFGQKLLNSSGTDASGNAKIGDIGIFLKDKISAWLKTQNYPDSTLKYIDPSYTIRSCPATSNDAAFCTQLASYAVHEAFAGSTGSIIGYWAGQFTVVPVPLATSHRKTVDLQGPVWRAVREITVSSRRGILGPRDAEDVLSNATSAPAIQSTGAINQLQKRVEELEALIGAVRARETVKDKKLVEMKDYSKKLEESSKSGMFPPVSPDKTAATSQQFDEEDDEEMLNALASKYSQQKQKMNRTSPVPE